MLRRHAAESAPRAARRVSDQSRSVGGQLFETDGARRRMGASAAIILVMVSYEISSADDREKV